MFSPALRLRLTRRIPLLATTCPYLPGTFQEFSCTLQVCCGGARNFVPQVVQHDLSAGFGQDITAGTTAV